MKYYIQFLDTNSKGDICEALGSDGVFVLDGRNNLRTMFCDGINRHEKLLRNYKGFKIMKGDRFSDDSKCLLTHNF